MFEGFIGLWGLGFRGLYGFRVWGFIRVYRANRVLGFIGFWGLGFAV